MENPKDTVPDWLSKANLSIPPLAHGLGLVGRLYEVSYELLIALAETLPKDLDNHKVMQETIRNEAQRLYLWGHPFDIEKSELDVRLESSEETKSGILEVFCSLGQYVILGLQSPASHVRRLIGFRIDEYHGA